MRVLRGRERDHERDFERTREMGRRVADAGVPALRLWTPHQQVVFGRRDRRAEGYDRARAIGTDRGYAVLERAVGGRAVAYTGTTVAFALAEPIDDGRERIGERYDRTLTAVRDALTDLGADVRRGEPPDSFCPGSHSLQSQGKLVGLAQRVRQTVALTAGIVIVCDHERIAAVLGPVYDALDVPFDPDSVGSIARAGGLDDADVVLETLESAIVGECAVTDRTHIQDT